MFTVGPNFFKRSFVGSRAPWENDGSTLLLIHAEGADGSSSIVDSSSFGRTITVGGGARLSTAQAAVETSSIDHIYAGAGYLSINMSGLQLDTDFCIEMWTKHSSNNVLFYLDTSCYLYNNFFRVGNVNAIAIDTTPSDGAWHHFRINRSGSTVMAWLDGALQGSYSYSGTLDASTIQIGRFAPNDNLYFDGYSDEIRVSGVSRDTTAFIPNPA